VVPCYFPEDLQGSTQTWHRVEVLPRSFPFRGNGGVSQFSAARQDDLFWQTFWTSGEAKWNKYQGKSKIFVHTWFEPNMFIANSASLLRIAFAICVFKTTYLNANLVSNNQTRPSIVTFQESTWNIWVFDFDLISAFVAVPFKPSRDQILITTLTHQILITSQAFWGSVSVPAMVEVVA